MVFWKNWINNLKLQKKMVLMFILFGILPMIVITGYTYKKTKDFLWDRTKGAIESELRLSAFGIEERFRGFSALLDQIAMDRELLNYLNQESDERLDYIDEIFAEIVMLHPDISHISIYSTNRNLPKDEYYLHTLSQENPPDWYQEVLEAEGASVYQSLPKEPREKHEIFFLKELIDYEHPSEHHIIKMNISENIWEQFINREREEVMQVVVDQHGIVLAGGEERWLSYELIKFYNERTMMATWGELKPVGWMCAIIDKTSLNKQMVWNSGRILLACLLISIISFWGIYKSVAALIKTRMEQIKQGMNQIGVGDFSWRFPYSGKDEIGEIEVFINEMTEKLEESYKRELVLKGAELALLQERIQPHFLYNSLASVSSMIIQSGNIKEAEMLSDLSDFYRITLNQGKSVLTIEEELRLTECYLNLQNVRFENLLKVHYEVDLELVGYQILKLVLQPVVENSIKHGRKEELDELNLWIRIFKKEERIMFEVEDDGVGMSMQQLYEIQGNINSGKGGYGLFNTHNRIQNYYGREYGVCVESEYGLGTKVTIEIPMVRKAE